MNFIHINIVMLLLGWCWCYLLGAQNFTTLPILLSFFSAFLQLRYVKNISTPAYCLDVMTAIYALFFGFIIETIFICTQILHYATENAIFCYFPPGWVITFYLVFSLTLNHSCNVFNKIPALGIPLLLFGSGIHYKFVTLVHAATINPELPFPYLFIILLWGLFLPIMLFCIRIAARHVIDLSCKSHATDNEAITIFYDGSIFAYQLAVKHIKKQTQNKPTYFVDLAQREYGTNEYIPTSQQVYAINAQGVILKGENALYQLYVRCGYPILALFHVLPFFKQACFLFYALSKKLSRKKCNPIPPVGHM